MTILYILLALVVLMILITVHEFGHYIAGKALKFKINEFSIGFGPAIFQKKKKDGEAFSIRLIPLGGYCAFEGEDEEATNPNSFNSQKAWKRLIVTFAGVTFNFLFGIIMSVVFLLVSGYSVPKIAQVATDNTYFKPNDIVTAVNGKSLEIYRKLGDLTKDYGENEEFVVTVLRNGEEQDIVVAKKEYSAYYYMGLTNKIEGYIYDVGGNPVTYQDLADFYSNFTPVKDADGKYSLPEFATGTFKHKNEAGDFVDYTSYELNNVVGLQVSPKGVSLGFVYTNEARSMTFFEAVGKAWPFAFYICDLIFRALGGIFTGATQLKDLGGTVTAVSQMVEISKMGFVEFLMLFPLLSFNLALFNVLPIPALDGARALFILIEMIVRKPVPRKIEGIIHAVGLILLLALVIFLDVYHFFIM